MDRSLLKEFFNCGDDQIIQFAIMRAHLNRNEKNVIESMLDECLTQEATAEKLDLSVRTTQEIWYSASKKLLSIPWVSAYARELRAKS